MAYYNEDGHETLARHPLNSRYQESVLAQYEKGILEHGVVEGVRGVPWLQQAKSGHVKLYMITNGTVTMALYRAKRKHPDNPQVLATIAAGLKGCTIMHADMPSDVVFGNHKILISTPHWPIIPPPTHPLIPTYLHPAPTPLPSQGLKESDYWGPPPFASLRTPTPPRNCTQAHPTNPGEPATLVLFCSETPGDILEGLA